MTIVAEPPDPDDEDDTDRESTPGHGPLTAEGAEVLIPKEIG